MHLVAKSLAYLFADVLPQADDEARRSHFDDLPIVWHAVEGGVNHYLTVILMISTPFAVSTLIKYKPAL